MMTAESEHCKFIWNLKTFLLKGEGDESNNQ